MLGAPGDVVDPLSQPSAFSFLPRTVAAAGFAVSSEIQLDQTFSRLISVGAKENVSNPYTNSDVMENERNENIRNNVMVRRLPPMHKRGRFSLLPAKELDPVPLVDYSVLAHIEDPYEFFKTSERLEKAEKEIKRLRGEVITEDYRPRPRRPQTGLRRTSYTHTYTLPDTLLEDSPLSGSQNASPPKDSNTAKEGLNAIPVEVSSSVKDTAPKRASTTIVDTLLSNFKNITKDQEEAVLWETLKLKPTDIGETNICKLLKSRMDNNPVSSSKGCLIPETSEGIASARNPYPAISELQRQIFERNPLMKSPIVMLPDDDDLIEDPFPSASRPSASSLSPKDVLKSGEKNPESSKGLEEKVSSGAASSSKFTSVFQQFSFQDEENVMPSYAGPSDAADNTVEEIASQVKVPEVSRFEVDKDVSSGGKNAEKSRSPFHANKTGNRIGKDVFASVDHEFSLDDEPSSQNVNVGTHDGPVADNGDTSLPDKEELVPTRKRGRPRKLNKEISNTTPKSCSGDAVDLRSSNPPDSSNINFQALEAPKDGAGSKVSLQNPIVTSQEKLVPSRKRGRPRKLNKEISNTTPKICSGDSVDVPSQNLPVNSNINIQVGQEESQIRKGRKRTVGRQSKGGSSSNERSLPGLDGQPEIPPPTSENEVQVEASPMESPREKKQKAAPRKQSKKKANLRKSLADGGLVWEAGVRRSTRVKSRPLKYWLGERFLYSRIHASLATVVGVKALSPTSKGPVMKVKSFVPDKYTELVEKIGKY